jgi:hypothetical protein
LATMTQNRSWRLWRLFQHLQPCVPGEAGTPRPAFRVVPPQAPRPPQQGHTSSFWLPRT